MNDQKTKDQKDVGYEHEHKDLESARSETEDEGLGFFDKLLPLWIGICIVFGLLLSQYAPSVSKAIDEWQIEEISLSIPIGICLFLMMYPAMLNLKGSELKKLGRD